MTSSITKKEKEYLRDLAKKQLEYANLAIMKEREKLWFEHNDLKSTVPVVIMEITPFRQELYEQLKCSHPIARKIEDQLLTHIVNHEMIDDDKVIPKQYTVNHHIHIKEHGFDIKRKTASDQKGRQIGYAQEHPIKDLKKDFHKIDPSSFYYDKESTLDEYNTTKDLLEGVMPVQLKNNSLHWYMSFTARIVNLMGMERLMYSMMDHPKETHELFQLVIDDSMKYMEWQEKEGLLTLNNNNDKAGAGSYGFTNDLPLKEHHKTGKITLKDLWGNMNSQESVGISPDMYNEFVYPYYKQAAQRFGLIYYGCCEPVHTIWESAVSKLPNLRKVSISAWCDQEYMGEQLKNKNVIYSRKPSPNYLGVGSFDEDEFRKHIEKTLVAAKECVLEIIFRDIYTLDQQPVKAKRAVKIVRELINDKFGS